MALRLNHRMGGMVLIRRITGGMAGMMGWPSEDQAQTPVAPLRPPVNISAALPFSLRLESGP
jgi:hypothetical protein